MLPNPKKTKKIPNLLTDQDTNLESESEAFQKRLLLKRRLILISLLMTAGVSLVFWGFRTIQKIIRQPSQINFKIELPKLNLSSKTDSAVTQLDKFLLPDYQSNWSVISVTTSRFDQPIFSQNYDNFNFNQTVEDLSVIKPASVSLIDIHLPQGLSFQEKVFNKNGLTYQNLISLPSESIIISVFIDQADSLEQVKSQLSVLVESLYWYSVKHLN